MNVWRDQHVSSQCPAILRGATSADPPKFVTVDSRSTLTRHSFLLCPK